MAYRLARAHTAHIPPRVAIHAVTPFTRELRRNGAPTGYAEVLATSKSTCARYSIQTISAPEAASASAPEAASASAPVPSAEPSEKKGIALMRDILVCML